ncbi:pyridoxamine 5-phosphate oxidase [Aggregicoccus sp. 17bor-14]|uniref:pyridoxamine 5'-phosphate oxidase family protein n=1 Tax=Myxococcaceae TaxID=31 RepID=UPI00129D1E68|nr:MULTISPECIES: pyridoxamine 5'-phosphate oxidase family protein [Myxococcaceae]MBF5045677.1 pyridoxamine 5'-phosphate oxidase family protein [Simulacricoccus sp. 17bor-14]MRI91414.1 pyridoxamine 5-phosphate oxidase [Aggregicoccus sp. 17bor-14]
MDPSPFHSGELTLQQRAGVSALAQRVGRGIRPALSQHLGDFLAEQPFVLLAYLDAEERPRLRLVDSGAPERPVLEPLDAEHVQLLADVGALGLRPGDPFGLLAIELATRSRVRLNGTFEASGEGGARLRLEQVYGNCPKYIQARGLVHVGAEPGALAPLAERIAQADTFFIATGSRALGLDASHRGGRPGFIHQPAPGQLLVPDYKGNAMFNSLGNVELSPQAALLLVDFARGSATELLGRGQVLWDDPRQAEFPGAERLLRFDIESVEERPRETALRWRFESYSPFDPPPHA